MTLEKPSNELNADTAHRFDSWGVHCKLCEDSYYCPIHDPEMFEDPDLNEG